MAHNNNSKRLRSPSSSSNTRHERLISPIHAFHDVDELYAFLRSKIKEQDPAMFTIAEKLLQMRDKRDYAHNSQLNVFRLLFSGPSGCGKTETVRWMRYLLGMDPGYEHERQYIDVGKEDKTEGHHQVVRPEPSALALSLNKAVCAYHSDASDDTTEEEEENDNGYGHDERMVTTYDQKRHKNSTSTTSSSNNNSKKRVRLRPPRFLMIAVDEADTLPKTFTSQMNQLLANGWTMTNQDREASFQLPDETTLVIVFTCNYGEGELRKLKFKAHQTAINHIRLDMLQKAEMSETAIDRMGDIVPFYPLQTETLRDILMERLEQFMKDTSICKQFGEITYNGDVKKLLIDKVINLTEAGRGIRQGLGRLLEKIGDFFKKALDELHRKGLENAKNALIMTLREIDLKHFDEQMEKECEQFVQEIMRCLLNDPRSIGTIQEYRAKQENLNALSMFVGERHLISSELGAVIYTHQQNQLFNRCQFGASPVQVARLKEENHELKETIGKVDTLVGQTTDASLFYEKVKDIVTESKKNLRRYSEEGSGGPRRLALDNRVEEIISDMSDSDSSSISSSISSTTTTSSTSSEEEEDLEKQREAKFQNLLHRYAHLDPHDLEEVDLSSEIDEDSEDDKLRIVQQKKQRKKKQLERLIKKHPFVKCIECKENKHVRCFNPTLYVAIKTGMRILHRKQCNACRKK